MSTSDRTRFKVRHRDPFTGRFKDGRRFPTREMAMDFIRSLDEDGVADMRNNRIIEETVA